MVGFVYLTSGSNEKLGFIGEYVIVRWLSRKENAMMVRTQIKPEDRNGIGMQEKCGNELNSRINRFHDSIPTMYPLKSQI